MSSRFEVFRVISGTWRENGYVVRSRATGVGVVVDPGCNTLEMLKTIDRAQVHLAAILLTHAHHDHVDGVVEIQERAGGLVHMHQADAALLRRVNAFALILGVNYIKVPTVDVWLRGDEALQFGDLMFQVVPLPGHTEGSVGYHLDDAFFVGDTILPEAVGRVDLPGGSEEALHASLVKAVSRLTPQTVIHPGHGDATSLAGLQTLNPAVRRALEASGMSPMGDQA